MTLSLGLLPFTYKRLVRSTELPVPFPQKCASPASAGSMAPPLPPLPKTSFQSADDDTEEDSSSKDSGLEVQKKPKEETDQLLNLGMKNDEAEQFGVSAGQKEEILPVTKEGKEIETMRHERGEMNEKILILFGFLLIIVHAWWIVDIVLWCYGVYQDESFAV